MQKLSTLARAAGKSLPALLLAVLAFGLTACGNDNDDQASTLPPPGNGNPPPETIDGIATPSSVAVVTATNAQ